MGYNLLLAVFTVSNILHANKWLQTLSIFFLPYVRSDATEEVLRCVVMLNTYRYDGLGVPQKLTQRATEESNSKALCFLLL